MFTQMKARRYVQKRRAESKDATRQRIVEATAELHEALGPRAATISAIAERAGVQRLTVYRHFPDETELFAACTAHWLAGHPLPDPAGWEGLAGPDRVRAALVALYRYYRHTERMWTVSYRDVDAVPGLQSPMAAVRNYLDAIRDDLASGLGDDRAGPALVATLGHAVQFATWKSLNEAGFSDAGMADLVCRWISGVRAAAGESLQVNGGILRMSFSR